MTTYPAIYRPSPDVTLYRGDCLAILPTLTGIDAVITDPPYGIGADKLKAHSSIRDNPRWPKTVWDSQRPAPAALRMVAGISDLCAIWGGNYFADCLPASPGWLIWQKPESETGFSLADAELCWTSCSFAVRVKTSPRRDGNEHPTQKPIGIMQWTMHVCRVQLAALVLDPYMGSGTTGIACIRTGRRFIGIEIDPTHYATSCRRIDNELQRMTLPMEVNG